MEASRRTDLWSIAQGLHRPVSAVRLSDGAHALEVWARDDAGRAAGPLDSGAGAPYESRRFERLDDALHCLELVPLSHDVVSGLRFLFQRLGEPDLWRRRDESILHELAGMLLDRRLVLVRRRYIVKANNAGREAMRVGAATTPSALHARAPVAPAAPQVAESDVLSTIDQDAQALVLLSAAAEGVPFCEACAAARQSRAAEAVPAL